MSPDCPAVRDPRPFTIGSASFQSADGRGLRTSFFAFFFAGFFAFAFCFGLAVFALTAFTLVVFALLDFLLVVFFLGAMSAV